MTRQVTLGKKGEEIAVKFLQKQNYRILERNFKKRYGEIDIVALDPSTGSGQASFTLVFIEVKTRFSEKYGPPEESVTPWKLRQIAKTGQFYKMLHPELPDLMRIDVVAVDFDFKDELEDIRLIKNAYTKGLS